MRQPEFCTGELECYEEVCLGEGAGKSLSHREQIQGILREKCIQLLKALIYFLICLGQRIEA